MGTSPAQRFLGRRCKTLLPLTNAQLQPQYATADDARTLQGQKAKQRYYYNRHARDLPAIARGDAVCMRLPGETTWTPGVCTGFCGPWSYRVQVGERDFDGIDSLRRPHFNQELYTENGNERAQLTKQSEGIIIYGYLELYTHKNICCYLSPVC